MEDVDIVKGLCDYVKQNLVEHMVLGVSVKSGIVRYMIFSSKTSIFQYS